MEGEPDHRARHPGAEHADRRRADPSRLAGSGLHQRARDCGGREGDHGRGQIDVGVCSPAEADFHERAGLVPLVLHADHVLPRREPIERLRERQGAGGLAVDEEQSACRAGHVEAKRPDEARGGEELHRGLAHHLDQRVLGAGHRMRGPAELLPGPRVQQLQVDHERIAELAGRPDDQLPGAGVGGRADRAGDPGRAVGLPLQGLLDVLGGQEPRLLEVRQLVAVTSSACTTSGGAPRGRSGSKATTGGVVPEASRARASAAHMAPSSHQPRREQNPITATPSGTHLH